jgi:hypothetical protein
VAPLQPDDLKALREAAKGLTYPSETDAPFDVLVAAGDAKPASSPEELVARLGGASGKVEEVPVDKFFGELDATDDVQRYRALRRVLESTLSGLRVLRVGSVKLDVYVIGRTRSGVWAGLHTTSVET